MAEREARETRQAGERPGREGGELVPVQAQRSQPGLTGAILPQATRSVTDLVVESPGQDGVDPVVGQVELGQRLVELETAGVERGDGRVAEQQLGDVGVQGDWQQLQLAAGKSNIVQAFIAMT